MERRATIPGQERIPATLIRFSVGCEDVEDLWADLEQSLDTTSTSGTSSGRRGGG